MHHNKNEKAICPLNLPIAKLNLRSAARGTEVYDPLRKRWVTLTPEEWVRQHFTAFMTKELGYPPSLIANEMSISLNGTSKRCDSVVYNPYLRPVMIVEYKAPHVAITQKVFDQIARYNIALNVKYLVVSNGINHYCCAIDNDNGGFRFLHDIPSYHEL